MENSISTGTKEFATAQHGRAREKDNNYSFRRVLLAEVSGDQPINNDYVDGERGIGERDGAAHSDADRLKSDENSCFNTINLKKIFKNKFWTPQVIFYDPALPLWL